VTLYRGDGEDSVDRELLFHAGGMFASALVASGSDAQARHLFGAFAYVAPRAPEIRYQRGAGAPAFGELYASAATDGTLTHLVLPNSNGGRLISVLQGPKENLISDGVVDYHRWQAPTGKLSCRGN
jgi:hypothetical protein